MTHKTTKRKRNPWRKTLSEWVSECRFSKTFHISISFSLSLGVCVCASNSHHRHFPSSFPFSYSPANLYSNWCSNIRTQTAILWRSQIICLSSMCEKWMAFSMNQRWTGRWNVSRRYSCVHACASYAGVCCARVCVRIFFSIFTISRARYVCNFREKKTKKNKLSHPACVCPFRAMAKLNFGKIYRGKEWKKKDGKREREWEEITR